MVVSHLDIRRTPRGLVPIIVGQPNDHIFNWLDWLGENYRRVNLPGWKRGRALPDTERSRQVLKALLRSVASEALQERVLRASGTSLIDAECVG